MPVPACVAQAAEDYRFNNNFLLNMVKDLTPDEWLKRPNECTESHSLDRGPHYLGAHICIGPVGRGMVKSLAGIVCPRSQAG